VKRRRLFRAALVGRCGNGGPEAAAAYQKLRTVFTTHVAGRYPFVDSTQSQAPDVDPIMLRDFLVQYDAFMASGVVALRTDAALLLPAREADAFLTAMVPVRAFLSPLVDAADRKPPEFIVIMPAADSATNRALTIGATTAPIDAQTHQYAWRFGDAIRLVQRDSARVHQVFSSARGWSILALPGQASVRIFHPTTRVELTPPAGYPAVAPDMAVAAAPLAAPAVTPPKSVVPAAKPGAAVAKAKAPVAAAKAPAAKPKAPAAKGKAPAAKSKAPAAKSKAPAVKGKAPTKRPLRGRPVPAAR
jgi:hypothetical protein